VVWKGLLITLTHRIRAFSSVTISWKDGRSWSLSAQHLFINW